MALLSHWRSSAFVRPALVGEPSAAASRAASFSHRTQPHPSRRPPPTHLNSTRSDPPTPPVDGYDVNRLQWHWRRGLAGRHHDDGLRRLPVDGRLLRCVRRRVHSASSSGASNVIGVSSLVGRTTNPIREIVDRMHTTPNPNKELIPLSIGDPTVYGNFKAPQRIQQRFTQLVQDLEHNGYVHSAGIPAVRETVAKKFSPPPPLRQLTAEDVVLTWGCSQALEFAISVLAEPHKDAIILPRPGFPLYATLCRQREIGFRYYDLKPQPSPDGTSLLWAIDQDSLARAVEDDSSGTARAILVNNPANPTGSVFSRTQLQHVIGVAEKYDLPIVGDEIYANMVFDGCEYHSLSSLSASVPVLEVGGIAKQYMVPGWRVGWALVHDRDGKMHQVRRGLHTLATVTLGPCSLVQPVVETLLMETPEDYYKETMLLLEEHARVFASELKGVQGLEVVSPQGAMYAMVRVDCGLLGFDSDVDLSRQLLEEESVFVLPGQCFESPGYVRVVLSPPLDKLTEAARRLREFCARHRAEQRG